MKAVQQLVLLSLLLSLLVANISQAAGVRIVVVEDGTRNYHLRSDAIGDTIIVGTNAHWGAAKVYVQHGKNWKEHVELLPGGGYNAEEHEKDIPSFGTSVALTAPHELASPDYAIVGAPKDNPKSTGSVHIFSVNRRSWKQQARIVAADKSQDDRFGTAVGIERNIAVVGAPGDDDAGTNAGSAYVFMRSGTQWRQKQKLLPGDLTKSNEFGRELAIYKDVIVVGAPRQTHGGIRFSGAAYVFVHDGNKWVEQSKLTADDAAAGDNFGTSVAVSGKTIIVGAPLADAKGKKDTGAAYVFVRDGNSWKQSEKLVSSDAKKSDQFGLSVATNGNITLVGAMFRNEGAAGSGAAYLFTHENNVWTEKKKVLPEDEGVKINFGAWVAISANTLLVSAHNAPNEGPESGNGVVAYVYNSAKDFGTAPYTVEPFGQKVTTLAQVKHTTLYQNFPNPFNPDTWLPYQLADGTPVTLRIHNVRGELAREFNLGTKPAGVYLTRESAAYWDGKNQIGETVSSGIYFYTLSTGTFQATRRMLILK